MQKVTEIEKAELLVAVKSDHKLHNTMRRLLIEHDRLQQGLDKQKMLDFLNEEIKSCEIIGNESDEVISWECRRIMKRISMGMFDSDK